MAAAVAGDPGAVGGGLLGLALAVAPMRIWARRHGLPLVPRLGRSRVYLDMPRWRFVLGAVIPIYLVVTLLGEECWVHRPIWEFSAHSWEWNVLVPNVDMITFALIGRWFARHALKDHDVWGFPTTKGRIAPAPRVGR